MTKKSASLLAPVQVHLVRLRRSRSFPAAIKHSVHHRDQGQCTHRDLQGGRCKERRWLDIHHLTPVSQGGFSILENLTTLCKAHHQMIHAQLSPGRVEKS